MLENNYSPTKSKRTRRNKVILKQNHELQKSNEQLKQELVKSSEIDNNIEKLSTKPAQTEKIMEVINPESKVKGGNKIVTKKKTPVTDKKKTDENIKLIWDAIDDVKEILKNLVISVNKSTGNSNEKRQLQRKGKNVPKTAKTILRNNQWTVQARTNTKKKRNPDRHQLRTIIKLLRVTMAALKKDLVKWKVKLFSLRKLNSVYKLK